MASFFGVSQNVSFHTVPAAFLLLMSPHWYSLVIGRKYYDNAVPRSYVNSVANNPSIDKITKGRITRAEATMANGLETFGFFAAGVAAGNAAKVPAHIMNNLAISYVASRVVYTLIYVKLQDNRRWAGLRTIVWWVGCILSMSMFAQAGAYFE